MVEDPPLPQASDGRRGSRLDYIGISLLALGVGALQVMLDKGQEEDWFGSHFIVTLACIAAVCLTALVVWELHYAEPILDLRLFKNYNFAVANLMMFILGVVLFSSLVMLPQFLQTLMGYTAQSAGMVLFHASGFVVDPDGNADCRPAHDEISGEIHYCLYVAGCRSRAVCTTQSAGWIC